MKIKIDHVGNLKIYRNSICRDLYCPYTKEYTFCGDWCALFNDPEEVDLNTRIVIKLCHNKFIVNKEDLIDER